MGALTARTNTYGLTGRSLRWSITLTATLGFSLFGYDQGLMSGIITGPQFNAEFPPTAGNSEHANVIRGAVTSCYELGCFFGAIFVLIKGDKIGRRPLVIVGSAIIILGTIISVSAFGDKWGLGQFVIGRVVTGVGNGMNTATIPVWQSEISRAENRGRLVNLEGSVIAVGTLIAYWIDFGLSYVDSSVQWRFPVAFQIVFALFVIIGLWGLPESPRWLIAHDRYDEAEHILAALQGLDRQDENVQTEIRVIMEAVSRAKHQVTFKQLFSSSPHQYLRRMLIGSSSQFFQQFTGCNASIYYSTVLFQDSIKLERRLSLILGGIFAIVYAIFTIPSFFLVDRIGRRKLFLIGAVGQGVAFIITMGCLIPNTKEASKGAAFGIFLFIAFFAFTILPLPWIYPPEINPLSTRTVATGVSTCTNWLSNFAVVMFTPPFINSGGANGWGCYLFFAIMNFLFVPIIYFWYPETAGRSLEEVDIIFAKAFVEKKAAFRVAATMPTLSSDQVKDEAHRFGLIELEEFEKEKIEEIERTSVTSASAEETSA